MTQTLEELFGPPGTPALPLPVKRLSPSSIDGFWKCPEQWRRERIGGETLPATGKNIFGSAFDAAATFNYRQKIESHEDLPAAQMRDLTGDAFNTVMEEERGQREIDWGTEKPHLLQAEVIAHMVGSDSYPGGYHGIVAPTVQPVAVQRWTEVELPIGVPLVGKIDLETDAGVIVDIKTSAKTKTQDELDKSLQATSYLYARAREGNPAQGFGWHASIRTKTPKIVTLETTRSAGELAMFERLLTVTARTIHGYMETYGPDGPWPGASPLGWWCAPKTCSFWATCSWRGGAK